MCYFNPSIHARVTLEPPFAHGDGDGGGGDGGMKLLKLALSYSHLDFGIN